MRVMGARAESLTPPRAQAVELRSTRTGLRLLEREAFPIAAAALYAVALLLLIPGELVQDSWSTLVTGKLIAANGLPQHETLTAMAHGVRWVDQQWLAQLTFYELFRVGGYRLILLVHVALIASAFGLALVVARRRGASPRAVFVVALLCFFVAPWGWQLRAQSFAPLLFVAVLGLLVADGQRRSRRILLTLPLLALWANLHGSVILGAALVALYGLVLVLGRRDVATGGLLFVAAPICVIASPYGPSLVGYYRDLLVDPPFRGLIVEWTAPTPQAITALFYVLAFVTAWALGRSGRVLTRFEQLALLVTLASALTATRNIVWFGLTALVLLPVLIGKGRLGADGGARTGVRLALALTALVGLTATLTATMAKPSHWYVSGWPKAAAAQATASSGARSSRVFASDRMADWLLWHEPALRGRVAFDIRFELNTAAQIHALHRFFGRTGPHWQAAARGYDVIVIDRQNDAKVLRALESTRRFTRSYADHDMVVLTRIVESRKFE
jgi:hypothetical protein